MKIGKTKYFKDRKAWRKWLEDNFDSELEIWLIFPYKATGKPRVPYNDAVEEAICFGWIDSTVNSIDEEKFAQRFTPRNPKSKYSQLNKERLRWLLNKGMLHSSIKDSAIKVLKEAFVFPSYIIDEIKTDTTAWRNYQRFPPAYKRIRVAYIDSARKHPEEFRKRLANFIKKTKENKKIGFGGIEKY